MRKQLIILIIALFLISGCAKKIAEEPGIMPRVCEPPRIMYEGECCLDSDGSGVCDFLEEIPKIAEQIEEEKEAEIKEEKIPDQCTEMSSWVTCEDVDIMYDKVLGRGLIKIQLQNNRDGILVIKNFKFTETPSCNKELSWGRDTTGMKPGESGKYVIECNALSKIDLLDTAIAMDVNYYATVEGLDPGKPTRYDPPVEQTIKGRIKGST